MFPEYTGAILQLHRQERHGDQPRRRLRGARPRRSRANLVALDKAEAQDSDAIVVTKETADKFKLKTIEDLAKKN